ncbi:Rubrerythrin [Dehalogenimonas formicexedens]|uniref:Rubrerythrin n=1 Tax=Dehalogenimonas formicexedens TaxID=1839801 RepID=A0A1P8F6T0_9CHLR|nr:ferritin family protein [Dehalogenimonas formicexedens]APV44140.1 Rubrerythrin [Dehalogenimonas formicexedens]
MNAELSEILETAMLKEVASAAMYRQAVTLAPEPAVATLLEELAEEEGHHLAVLKNLNSENVRYTPVLPSRIVDLKLTDHLKGPSELPGAELTEALLFAIKREADSVGFYTSLMGLFSDEGAKNLCQALAWQEMAHKAKLELLYDRIVYTED